MVSITVIDKSTGLPAEGKKVAIYVKKFLANTITDVVWTDRKGEAYFELESNEGTVYIEGARKYEGQLSERLIIYL